MIKRNKTTARYISNHSQDRFTDLGFDYRGRVFEKSISASILKNPNNRLILAEIENLIVYLIDTVKQVRLQFMISLDKTDRNVN